MTPLYRFQCWEQSNPTYSPSLVATCGRTGRLGYFDNQCDLTFDITSMAVTPYMTPEGEPLIAIALTSQPHRITLYSPLCELADAIAGQQDDTLWRMLRMISNQLPLKHRLG